MDEGTNSKGARREHWGGDDGMGPRSADWAKTHRYRLSERYE